MRPCFLLCLLLCLACPAAAQERLKVVATFSILGDLTSEVGGERVEVTTFVAPDTDAHTYQPKPTDIRALAAAKVLVSNGLGFEGWIDRLADAAAFKGTRIVASAGVPATGTDPHCWQDVACTRLYVGNIAAGLSTADPQNAAFYRGRAEAYDKSMRNRGAEGQWGSAPHGTDGTPDTRGPSAGDHREGVGGGGG